MKEHVVLIDKNNKPIGLADKYEVHTGDTPLHRGFSLFIINRKGELLLQKRSELKKTWPGIWSNSVCGHPMTDEVPQQAAVRRADYELGISLDASEVKLILPNYRYKYEHRGVVENEICPVMVAFCDVRPKHNPLEVAETKWITWDSFINEISRKNDYSEWCQEEARLLNQNFIFKYMIREHTSPLELPVR